MKKTTSKKLATGAIWLVVAVALMITFARLFFGIDFTDESYYVALDYRFLLGDKPFIDEVNVTQTMAFVTYPLVKMFYALTGGTEGIILFTRICYYFFTLTIAALCFVTTRKRIGNEMAALISLVPVTFIPLGLPNMSYNTLGIGFLLLGLFLFANDLIESKTKWIYLAVGALNGVGTVAYPPLGAVNLIVFLLILSFGRKEKAQRGALYCAGGILVGLTYWVTFDLDVMAYLNELQRITADPAILEGGPGAKLTTASKIAKVLSEFWKQAPALQLLALLTAAAYFGTKRYPKVTWAVLPTVIHFSFFHSSRASQGGLGPAGYILYVGLVAPFLLPLLEPKFYKPFFVALWVPSFIAAVLMGYSSSNGLTTMGYGLLPAFIVTMIFTARVAASYGTSPIWVGCAMVLCLLWSQRSIYMDDPIQRLTAKVTEGPFKGLHTTPEKYAYYKDLADHLRRYENSEGRVLFMPHFPAGYLMTRMRPAALSVWTSGSITRNDPQTEFLFRDYYQAHLNPKNIVVQFRRLYITTDRSLFFEENDYLLATYMRGVHQVASVGENQTFFTGLKR